MNRVVFQSLLKLLFSDIYSIAKSLITEPYIDRYDTNIQFLCQSRRNIGCAVCNYLDTHSQKVTGSCLTTSKTF